MTESEQRLLPRHLGKCFPEADQQNRRVLQRGGVRASSVRMVDLLELSHGIAEANRRVPASRQLILPGTDEKVERFRDGGYFDCFYWTGPLPADAAGFKKGERPGENAVDTKTTPQGQRCTLTIRNCYLHGFNQPAQISNCAALNLKENVHARIDNCVFRDNEICLRLRGPGKRGGALVEIKDCAIYDSLVGVRMEDKIRELKITGLGFGPGVTRKYQVVGGGTLPGYDNQGERIAPPLELLLKIGFSTPFEK